MQGSYVNVSCLKLHIQIFLIKNMIIIMGMFESNKFALDWAGAKEIERCIDSFIRRYVRLYYATICQKILFKK